MDNAQAVKILARKLDEMRAATLTLAMGPERILDFAAFDTAVRLHLPYAATDATQRIILLENTFYEHRQMQAVRGLIPPGAVVVDAGANIGNHTVFFGLICRAAVVHAFEPLRTIYSVLERNVMLNGLVNVRCHNTALGAVSGHGTLTRFSQGNIAASEFALAGGTDYPVMPLDALPLDRLDFLKIDVEGTQIPMLEGARATIARHRPTIWIELRPAQGEYEPGDAMMRSLGYRQDKALSAADFLYVPAVDEA